jgi:hypothetical protein
MRILFLADRRVDAGSIHALAHYTRVGNKLGHTIAVYGGEDPRFPEMHFSTDVGAFDYVIFVFESKLHWMSGLQLMRVLLMVPKHRRLILDADGMYNHALVLDGYDRNHAGESQRAEWLAYYRHLADRILQPTVTPQEPDVEPLLFYGYDASAIDTDAPAEKKRFDIIHVAHNWWRWHEVSTRLLPALERIRSRVGAVAFVGLWWDGPPAWARSLGLEAAFDVDPDGLRRAGVEVHPPVRFNDVIPTMSAARVNLMTQRPLLRHLGFVTSKYFEIFTATTIPLMLLDAHQAALVYGPSARALTLDGDIAGTLLDALERPQQYHQKVEAVRQYLAEHHSYERRVLTLVRVLEG